MKKFWIYFLIPTLFIACSGGSDQNTEPNTIDNYNRTVLLENLTDNIIIPRYDNLVSQTNQLNTLAANFTTDQSAENFQLLKNAWAQTYIAWQYVEMFNIGKAKEINYIQSMNTYPCNPTQIEINIETLSYNLDDANYQSWASQGMPALDYMFYGLDSDTNNIITKYTGSEGEKYLTYLNNLIDQISLTPSVEIENSSSNFTNLNFLVSLGENYLKSVDIDFNSNEAVLSLESLPEIQYRLIKNTVGSLNVEIISENVASNENLISGEIKIGFYNE